MLDEHYDYHSTRNRHALFERAIAATVRPGDRVADLGCGTGILGLMCLKAGAGFSYEIETGPILEAARETFLRTGFAERAAFIREKTNRVTLPEPVDLLICDHVGYFGIDYGIIAMLQDARRRFLAPGGRIMPLRLVLRLAPVSSRKAFRRVTRWRAPKIAPEFRWLNDLATHQKQTANLAAEDLLQDALPVAEIDFREDIPESLVMTAEFKAAQSGPLHGLAGWFEAELAPGIWMTNAPGHPKAITRPQAFFPIDPPIDVSRGEVIRTSLVIRHAEETIVWEVQLPARKIRVRRSTLEGELLDAAWRKRAEPGFTPRLSAEARAWQKVLACCDGTRTTQEVIAHVQETYPDLMPSAEEIAAFVTRVIERDTQ